MKKLTALALATLSCIFASSANAGLIVELTREGADGVKATFTGSGTGSIDVNCQAGTGAAVTAHCTLGYDMGDYTTVNNTSFALSSPLALAPASGVSIVGLYIDDDGGLLDEGGVYLDVGPTSPFAYDVSGSSFITGLSFSSLNVGTYTTTSGTFDSLTYIIREVPAPATLALFGLGLAGIGYQRRKQIKSA